MIVRQLHPSLDEHLQEFANMSEAERASRWACGDIICRAIQVCGTRETRGKLLRAFAQIGHCSEVHCRHMAMVSATFPKRDRLPDVSWSLYRAVAFAAKRQERDPVQILQEALDKGWHAAQVAAQGTPQLAGCASWRGICPECATRVSVTADAVFRGRMVPCPLCEAVAAEDGPPSQAVMRLGPLL